MTDRLEDSLKRYHQGLPADHAEARRKLLTTLSLPATSEPHPFPLRKWIMRSTITGLAASLMVAILIWATMASGPTALYAQAIEGIEKARTVHIKDYWLVGGFQKPGHESWYDRDRGFVRHAAGNDRKPEQGGSPTTIEIDDGKHAWTYIYGMDYVTLSPSAEARHKIVDHVLVPYRPITEDQWKRAADRDLTVGNVRLKAYVHIANSHLINWVDDEGRLRRLEDRLEWDGEVGRSVTEIEYDVPVDPALFKPEFGPGVRTVDAAEVLAVEFPPEPGVFAARADGELLTIHKLVRVDQSTLYAVMSFRPEPVGAGNGAAALPTFRKWKGLKGWKDIDLSIWQDHRLGANVRWTLFVRLPGDKPGDLDAADHIVALGTSTDPSAKGPDGKSKVEEFPLPVGADVLTLAEVVASIRADVEQMERAGDVELGIFEKAPPVRVVTGDGRVVWHGSLPSKQIDGDKFQEKLQPLIAATLNPPPPGKAWYFDVVTKEYFTDVTTKVSPFKRPSGNEAVRAHFFSCGECTEDQKFLGYYEKYTDEVKQKIEDADDSFLVYEMAFQGRLYSADAQKWVAADKPEGIAITSHLQKKCPPKKLRYCPPVD